VRVGALRFVLNIVDALKLPVQGVKDPLNNAPVRAEELGRFCPNAEVGRWVRGCDCSRCVRLTLTHAVLCCVMLWIVRYLQPQWCFCCHIVFIVQVVKLDAGHW